MEKGSPEKRTCDQALKAIVQLIQDPDFKDSQAVCLALDAFGYLHQASKMLVKYFSEGKEEKKGKK